MITLELLRFEETNQGTFGTLKIHDGLSFVTAELPWRDNRNLVSCIPEGEYRCEHLYSKRLKRASYMLLKVPDRSGIRIHAANLVGDEAAGWKSDVDGCIALGRGMTRFQGQKGITKSREAVAMFEEFLQHQPFMLRVGWVTSKTLHS